MLAHCVLQESSARKFLTICRSSDLFLLFCLCRTNTLMLIPAELLISLISFGQMDIFPYSVFYIFFEQYLDIWRVALINVAIALGIPLMEIY